MQTTFELWYDRVRMGPITLNLPGVHNVYNALAAAAVARELDVDFGCIKAGLEGFTGVERRFHIRGEVDGVTVVDDYGHHPVEIKAVLRAAKKGWDRRLVVAFQPHRYSRTRDLHEEFLSAFNDADKLILTDIYAAGEDRLEGVSGETLYNGIKAYGHKDVSFVPDVARLPEFLKGVVAPGDMVITLGAGDIWKAGVKFLDLLKGKKA
jgi:UDP-N-acetylmuramate--alanine ligase